MERAQEITVPDAAHSHALREEGERLERLLAEIERIAGPTTWPRVEELVQRLVALYGAGLERIFASLGEAGALSDRLETLLCADELVSHLLMLHGLHPVPVEQRVARALEEVRPYLKSHSGGVDFLGIDPTGVVRLRLEGTCQGCHSSEATVEHTLRRAIEDAAPEVAGVKVESGTAADPGLVALHSQTRTRWRRLDDLPALGHGERHRAEIDGTQVLFLCLGQTLLAYRDLCRCGTSLAAATLEETLLCCPSCKGRFDVLHGGRGVDRAGGLTPIPLLRDEGGVRVAVDGAAQ